MSSIKVTASNVGSFDNYVLYRIWQEATTKKERSLAMKEIKRRQSEGNMSDGGDFVSHNKIPTKLKVLVLKIYKNQKHRVSERTYISGVEKDLIYYDHNNGKWELTQKGKFVAGTLIGSALDV